MHDYFFQIEWVVKKKTFEPQSTALLIGGHELQAQQIKVSSTKLLSGRFYISHLVFMLYNFRKSTHKLLTRRTFDSKIHVDAMCFFSFFLIC